MKHQTQKFINKKNDEIQVNRWPYAYNPQIVHTVTRPETVVASIAILETYQWFITILPTLDSIKEILASTLNTPAQFGKKFSLQIRKC